MNLKIALICFKYPPEYSGYGKQLKSVTREILKQDSSIGFFLLTAFRSSLQEEDDRLLILPLGTSRLKKTGLVFYLFCFRVFLWLIVNRNKYDIIHCIKAGPEAVVANIASKILNKKLIVKVAQDEMSEREIDSVKGIKKVLRKLRQYLLRNVDNYVSISEEIKENLLPRISKTTDIINIPNGVDTDHKFTPANADIKIEIKKQLEFPENEVIVLFVGAVNKRKGIYDLMAAIKNIKTINTFNFVICGPILENINLDCIIKDINDSNVKVNIMYKGKVDNVDQYMKAADIFVLPSYSEGLPNVLLEAASSGLALIATDIGGSRDIIEDSINGFLVPTGHPNELEKRLKELIDDRDGRLAMSQESRRIAVDRYSISQIANKYSKLYTYLYTSTNKAGEKFEYN